LIEINAINDYIDGMKENGMPRMASMTIRKIDENMKSKLRLRAAREGRSMEETAREILRKELNGKEREAKPEGLGTRLVRRFARFGGVELEPFPRGPIREPPKFD
jgi:antitoxin FitA